MKKTILVIYSILFFSYLKAQDSVAVSSNVNTSQANNTTGSVYHTSFKKDAPVILIGAGLTYYGNTLIKNKKPLTTAELATKSVDKIPFFDKGNVGYYDKDIDKASYIPFLGSFAMPLVMIAINKNESRNASQILVMYVESMSITSALFTMTDGLINRPRPLVYGTIAPLGERLNKNNQRSFFAGHTAATASATFFAAQVFQDLNPDSKVKTFVWVVAAAVPAVVGYMRYKSGFHFLSDNLLGYAVGAASGILIPKWHRSKMSETISFFPQVSKDYKGLALTYNFK